MSRLPVSLCDWGDRPAAPAPGSPKEHVINRGQQLEAAKECQWQGSRTAAYPTAARSKTTFAWAANYFHVCLPFHQSHWHESNRAMSVCENCQRRCQALYWLGCKTSMLLCETTKHDVTTLYWPCRKTTLLLCENS